MTSIIILICFVATTCYNWLYVSSSQIRENKFCILFFPLHKKRGRITRLLILTSMWGRRAQWRTSSAADRSGCTSSTAAPAGNTCRFRAKGSPPQLRMEICTVRADPRPAAHVGLLLCFVFLLLFFRAMELFFPQMSCVLKVPPENIGDKIF